MRGVARFSAGRQPCAQAPHPDLCGVGANHYHVVRMSSCYMCDAPATTREHVPPSCFFPAGYRTDLWTVPACRSHNQDNSPDVEYTRSIIALDGTTNQIARELV